jgi:hypothetical protein
MEATGKRKEAEMTTMLYELLQAYEEAEGLIVSIAAQIGGISEDLARLRGTVHRRRSGLRIALGKEPLLEEEGGHERAMREISPAEPLALPAEAEEETETSGDETSAEPDGGVEIVISEEDAEPHDVDINLGDEIRIVEGPAGEEPIL